MSSAAYSADMRVCCNSADECEQYILNYHPAVFQHTSKLVLFGAGASYGSGLVEPYEPPLGKDLYTATNSFTFVL